MKCNNNCQTQTFKFKYNFLIMGGGGGDLLKISSLNLMIDFRLMLAYFICSLSAYHYNLFLVSLLLSSLSFHLLQVEYHSSHLVLRISTMWRRSFGAHDMLLPCPSHVTPIMPLMTPPWRRIHLAQRDRWVTGTLKQTQKKMLKRSHLALSTVGFMKW